MNPELGYYARGTRQVGRGGDFFTSVSVGPLFGELLARRFLREWREAGRPGPLADHRMRRPRRHARRRCARGARSWIPRAFDALEYAIPEPLPALRRRSAKRSADFEERVRFLTDPAELAADPLPGIAFGNEVLDALPFHLVEWRGGRWLECRVATRRRTADSPGKPDEIHDPLLLAALAPLGDGFPGWLPHRSPHLLPRVSRTARPRP